MGRMAAGRGWGQGVSGILYLETRAPGILSRLEEKQLWKEDEELSPELGSRCPTCR